MNVEERKMSVETIVQNAIKLLPKDIAIKAIEKNWFVTLIQEVDPESYQDKHYVIIDTTKSMIFNEQLYNKCSEDLYHQFALTPKWYEC